MFICTCSPNGLADLIFALLEYGVSLTDDFDDFDDSVAAELRLLVIRGFRALFFLFCLAAIFLCSSRDRPSNLLRM